MVNVSLIGTFTRVGVCNKLFAMTLLCSSHAIVVLLVQRYPFSNPIKGDDQFYAYQSTVHYNELVQFFSSQVHRLVVIEIFFLI